MLGEESCMYVSTVNGGQAELKSYENYVEVLFDTKLIRQKWSNELMKI